MAKAKKLPAGIPADRLSVIYKKELERHSDKLIEEIQAVICQTPNSDVSGASVEVFPDDYGDGFVSIGMYFEGKNTKVDSSDKSIFPGRHIAIGEDLKDLPMIDVDSYDKFSVPDVTVNVVIQWFAECWWKAGGWNYPLRVEVCGHEGVGGSSILLCKGKSKSI